MRIVGLAALYNSPARSNSLVDGKRVLNDPTMFVRGCFDNAITSGDVVQCNIVHDDHLSLGVTGRNLTLGLTNKGLYFDCLLNDSPASRVAVAALRKGKMLQASVRHRTTKYEYRRVKGEQIKAVVDCVLIDVCICEVGADSNTLVRLIED